MFVARHESSTARRGDGQVAAAGPGDRGARPRLAAVVGAGSGDGGPRARLAAVVGAGSGDGGPRAQLAAAQRARIVAAATHITAELGYGGLTVSEVVVRARISRRTFYELFSDRDECFLAAFDAALANVAEPVLVAYREPDRPTRSKRDAVRSRSALRNGAGRQFVRRQIGAERPPIAWRERIAAALAATLALFDEQPALARLLVVETLAAGPAALERRSAVLTEVARAVEEGRDSASGDRLGPLAGEAIVGAVLAVLHTRILEPDRGEPLLALLGQLMSAIVLPYLGLAAATRELQRVAPAVGAAGGSDAKRRDPLHGLDMRLTYRTLRVLSAMRELGRQGMQPSNREIAAAAGIVDQGQASKLLARLQRLGLIENRQPGRAHGSPFKGEPNRWSITEHGAEIVATIRP